MTDSDSTENNAALLTPEQARVVAVLVEKSLTTPKYYPMTVNAITQGCNQKTSRSPVMNLTEGEVGNALLRLDELGLVKRDDSSARATKWSQRFKQQLELSGDARSVLAASVLRGPQTRAELRMHAEPLNGPQTAEALENALLELLTGEPARLIEFDRQPGQKEARLMHTLCGKPSLPKSEPAAPAAASHSGSELAELSARVSKLEAQVAELLAR